MSKVKIVRAHLRERGHIDKELLAWLFMLLGVAVYLYIIMGA